MDLSTGIRLQHSEGGLLSKYVGEHPPKYNHLTPAGVSRCAPSQARQAGQGRPGQLPTDRPGGPEVGVVSSIFWCLPPPPLSKAFDLSLLETMGVPGLQIRRWEVGGSDSTGRMTCPGFALRHL